MRKLTKSLSIIALAVITLLSFAFVLGTFGAKAETATEQLINSTAFTMEEGASVRIGLKGDGAGGFVATDYKDNGIRFTASMDKATYEGLEDRAEGGKKIVFGMIVARASDVKANPITEDSVFGDDAFYEVGKNVAYFETSSLIAANDCYYLHVSMVNLKEMNKAVEFIGVPYLKAIDENGFEKYSIKEYSLDNACSMAYVAQVEAETETDETIKNALLNNYVNGLTQDVEVSYAISYGTDKVTETATMTFALGEEITVDKISQKLITDGKVNAEYYTANGGTLEVNGQSAQSAIVYPNDKSGIELTVDYTAEQADASVLKGYYATDGNASVIFKSDNVLVYDAEPGMAQTASNYYLYKDGTLQVKLGDNYYYGEQANGKVNMTIGADEFTYAPATEVPAHVYANVRGYYEGTDSSVVVYANGTFTKDLKDSGTYTISYDKDEERFEVYSTLIAGVSEDSELVYNDGYEFAIAGVNYAKSAKTLASQETYSAFAKTYTADIPWVDNSDAGVQLSTTKFLEDMTLEFGVNGGVVWAGEEYFCHNSTVGKWAPKTNLLLSSTKDGDYVLFNDNTAKVFLPQMSTNANSSARLVTDLTYDATYNVENGTFSLDVDEYWYDGLYTSYEFTAVDGVAGVDMDALYVQFAGAVDSHIDYVEYSETWYTGGSNNGANWFKFYNGTTDEKGGSVKNEGYKRFYMFNGGWGLYGDYKLVPMGSNYGKVEMKFDTADNVATCYYAIYDGKVRMRISLNSAGSFPQNHFVDLYKAYNGDSFSSVVAFNLLAGNGGTVDTPVSKTYTGSGSSLTLYSDGVLDYTMPSGKVIPTMGVAKFDGKDVTYSVIPTSSVEGLFALDVSDTPLNMSFDSNRHVIGKYYPENGKYVIEFNFQGKDYVLSENGFKEKEIAASVIGTFVSGNANTLVITADTLTFNGNDYAYELQMSSLAAGVIALEESEILATYEFIGKQVKVVVDGVAFVKEYDEITELYAKYAGTYHGEYAVTYTSYTKGADKSGTMPMTITLNEDGTFSGVGKTFEGTMDTADSAYYDFITTDSNGKFLLPVKHLGNQPKTGTYTFKVIDGEVKIVLNFAGITSTYTDDSGYKELINGYYNQALYMQGTGHGISGNASLMPSGWSGITLFKSYNYASGVANGDTLSILFEAFTSTPIELTKVVAE